MFNRVSDFPGLCSSGHIQTPHWVEAQMHQHVLLAASPLVSLLREWNWMLRGQRKLCKLQIGPWPEWAGDRDCRDLLVSPSSQLQHSWGNPVAASNRLAWTGGKSCPTHLVTFYDKMTGLVDEGRAVDIVYLDFSVYWKQASKHWSPKRQWTLSTVRSS